MNDDDDDDDNDDDDDDDNNNNIWVLFLFVNCISQQEDRHLHVPFLIAPDTSTFVCWLVAQVISHRMASGSGNGTRGTRKTGDRDRRFMGFSLIVSSMCFIA